MNKKHTTEPWEAYVATFGGIESIAVAKKDIPESERNRAVAVISPTSSMDDEDIANARRIVACVNALEGISTEILEMAGTGLMSEAAVEVGKLTAQRDELLAALRALYGWTKAEVEHFGATCPDDFIIEMIEKALKNA